MSDKQHALIPLLIRQLDERQITKRDFIRFAALLGVSVATAGTLAGETMTPAAAAELPKGGVLRLGMRVPKLDDPHTFSWLYDANVVRQICGYLTRTGTDNVTRPALAAKWQVSDDLKTWTFFIADVTWHDGRAFTAEDAAWNIRRCLADETGSSVQGLMKAYMLKQVDKGNKDEAGKPVLSNEIWDANAIEAKDAKTLVLHLKEPNIALPEHLFHYPLVMLDPKEGANSVQAQTARKHLQ